MKTIADLKFNLRGLLQGINLDRVTNVDGAIERAGRTLVLKADVPEATGRHAFNLYNGVYNYAAPDSIFGGALLDLRPQGNSRNENDVVYRLPIAKFDRSKKTLPNGYGIAFEFDQGDPVMRVSSPKPLQRIILDSQTDDEGWTLAGSGSSLAEDEAVYYESPASLRMTLTGNSIGTLTKTISSQDLTAYEGVGVIFLAIYTPSATNLSSIAVRVGSSDANYFQVSETDGFLRAWRANEWTLVSFDLSGATETGTVDIENVDYLQFRITHADTLTNFRVGGCWISLPSSHELVYQTSALFKASGANPTQTITSDSDEIILSDSSFTLFELECAKEIAFQMGGGQASPITDRLELRLKEQYALYLADNPSEQVPIIGNWYHD